MQYTQAKLHKVAAAIRDDYSAWLREQGAPETYVEDWKRGSEKVTLRLAAAALRAA